MFGASCYSNALVPTLTMKAETKRADGSKVGETDVTLLRLGTSKLFVAPLYLYPERSPSVPAAPAVPVALGKGTITGPQTKAKTAFPGKLVLKFMKRDGSALTPSPDSDPAKEGTIQETEVLGESGGFAEQVVLSVSAVNPHAPTQIENSTALIGLVESPHGLWDTPDGVFYSDVQAPGGTRLDAAGRIDGAFRTLAGGRTEVSLRSLATARHAATGSLVPLPYAGGDAAILKPVPGDPADPYAPQPGEELRVGQWVDERAFDSTAHSWREPDAGNDLRDWLEKKFWGTAAALAAFGSELGEAASAVDSITEVLREGPSVAETTPTGAASAGVKWSLAALGVRARLPFQPHYDEAGLAVQTLEDPFRTLVAHEGRHAWQYKLKLLGAYTDGDGDFLLASTPISAPSLLDARYPVNPEFDPTGDDCTDVDKAVGTGYNAFQAPREVDAIRFARDQLGESTVGCGIAYDIDAAYFGSPGSYTIEATISVTVQDSNPSKGTVSVPYVGGTVLFARTSGGWTLSETGLSLNGSTCSQRWASVTNVSGHGFLNSFKFAQVEVNLNQGGSQSKIGVSLVKPPECGVGAVITKEVTTP